MFKIEIFISKVRLTFPTMVIVEVTRVSEKGQVVIPSSMRQELGIKKSDQFLIFGEGSTIILKKIEKQALKKTFAQISKPLKKAASKIGLTREDLKKSIKDVRRNA